MENLKQDEVTYIIKLKEEGETWYDIAEKVTKKFKTKRTLDSVRKAYSRYKEMVSEQDFGIKILKTNARTKGTLAQTAKENREILKDQLMKEDFLEEFKQLLKKNPITLNKPAKIPQKKPTKRVVVMHLSDMHFQANIEEGEMGGLNKYGSNEEARRLALFTREVGDYKKRYRSETELLICLNGDIMQGVIHDLESTPAITTQVCATLSLLNQSISYLAGEYGKIRVVCTVGNHERMMHKSNKGRQTREKWDSFATIVYSGLRQCLSGLKHVEFIISEAPYAYVDVLGHKFFITHSDTVLSIGYPGKSVNIELAKNKINELKDGIGPIDVVMVGHVHVDCKNILGNGTVLMTNGSMSGIDEFALSLGITGNNPTQQIFEVTPEHAVGDMRSVKLAVADKNSQLDKIIKPFKGKF